MDIGGDEDYLGDEDEHDYIHDDVMEYQCSTRPSNKFKEISVLYFRSFIFATSCCSGVIVRTMLSNGIICIHCIVTFLF